jgi:Trk-type K+ transport system membrane component
MILAIELILQSSSGDGSVSAWPCLGCSLFIIAPVIFFAVNIALLIWVARDAKSRGMDNSVIWMLLVMFTSFVGLFIYLIARTQGDLAICQSCGDKRLKVSAKCPHCGYA